MHPELPGQSREASIPNLERNRRQSEPVRMDNSARDRAARREETTATERRRDLSGTRDRGGQAHVKSCAVPRGPDRPQAPIMSLND